jgi:hypothetical protein
MNWITRWRLIAARITGLMDAANYLIQIFKVVNSDAFGGAKNLSSELAEIIKELQALDRDFGPRIPPAARMALQSQIENQENPEISSGHAAVYLQVLAPLAAFRSRFEYLIHDSEEEGRSATELSFEHLRRLITVDANVRTYWNVAFQNGEVACEKLGSVHLLNHGIWAFKAHAKGGATDLVYGDPLIQRSQTLQRTARAIVLTGWKVVRDVAQLTHEAEVARAQTQLYAAGVLGDLELKRTRYIVLVGPKDQAPPSDIESRGVLYRHIWIAVDPDTPSVQARKIKRKKGRTP